MLQAEFCARSSTSFAQSLRVPLLPQDLHARGMVREVLAGAQRLPSVFAARTLPQNAFYTRGMTTFPEAPMRQAPGERAHLAVAEEPPCAPHGAHRSRSPAPGGVRSPLRQPHGRHAACIWRGLLPLTSECSSPSTATQRARASLQTSVLGKLLPGFQGIHSFRKETPLSSPREVICTSRSDPGTPAGKGQPSFPLLASN